jgi:GST-like protein
MASLGWVVSYERQGQDLNDFPNLKRWFETPMARPAVIKAWKSARKNAQKAIWRPIGKRK